MNKFEQMLISVRFVGLMPTLRTLLYSRYRDRVDGKFKSSLVTASNTAITPTKIEDVKTFHNGAVFSFNDDLTLEVAFLSQKMVRITWQPGVLPLYGATGDATIALQVELKEQDHGWHMTAGGLQVFIGQDGRLSYISNGELIRVDQPPVFRDPAWTHQTKLSEDARIYGMGERTYLNLRPGTYRQWNQDPGGSYGPGTDPLYVTIPLFYCQQELGGYMAFYENSFESEARFDDSATFEFTGGALRLYIIEGDLPKTLEEYSRLTGRAPMPPQWSLGFHQCRWGYPNADKIREVVAGFKEHEMPLDVFHLDIDYMDGYRVFTNDPERYPDIQQLTGELEEDGIKTVVILDPGVKIDPQYGVSATGLKQDVFVKLPDGSPMRGLVWPGWVYFPDFTNPQTRLWWGSYYQRLVEDGVDGFWHDMNEPACFSAFGENTFPRVAQHIMEGRGGSHQEAHNVYGLEMDHAGFAALRKMGNNRRPWLLTRSGWAGVQRYAWKWTGDTESSWDALKMTIATVLGLGISGIPYAGSDIGGFSGDPDAELYTRWFQMSAFMAFFRNHAANATKPREPWVYGEPTTSILRNMLLVRKRFLPYLYTLTRDAHQSGAPLARPVFWKTPEDASLWDVDDEFLLGENVLVAPVTQPGADRRTVTLPQGGWYDFWADDYYDGSRQVTVAAPLEIIPVFIREGSLLPLQESDGLTLHLYLSAEDGSVISTLYQDAGDGYGASRLDKFTVERQGTQLTLTWTQEGSYPLPETVALQLHGGQVAAAKVDGKSQEWPEKSVRVAPFEKLEIELQSN